MTRWNFRFLFVIGYIGTAGSPEAASFQPIVQQAYLKPSNTDTNYRFGSSVAVSGRTVVIGAWGESSGARGVNGDQNDRSATNSGAAYVFVRQGMNWMQEAYLKASNTDAEDVFGQTVAIDGDTIVVGAPREASSATSVNGDQNDNGRTESGAAYVFVRDGSNWIQQAYLKPSFNQVFPGSPPGASFGWSVAISGDTILVGARHDGSSATGVNGDPTIGITPSAGAAYLFVREGTNWTRQAYLKPFLLGGSMLFGGSVAISSNTAVIGAASESSGATRVNGSGTDFSAPRSGAAYIFGRNGTNWSPQAYLKASNTGAGDEFGNSVAIDADTVAIGAHQEDSNAVGVGGLQSDNTAFNSGAAYVFAREDTNWSQQAYLKSSNSEGATSEQRLGDLFGHSVSVFRDRIIVGAPREDSGASGINGNQSDNSAPDSGAAYLFVRKGANWTQRAYIKPSNTAGGSAGQLGDLFGTAVALSESFVVVGAILEGSAATGVNGNESDNSGGWIGASYVFNFPVQMSITPHAVRGPSIRFNIATGESYQLQRAPMLNGPWETLTIGTGSSLALVEYDDLLPLAGQAFYRVVQP